MKQTMRAAFVQQFGQPLQIREVPIPEPSQGQMLIRTEACGVCHTDVHAADGDWPAKPTLPFIPGHEVVGTVVKLGAGVESFKVGDRAGVAWLFSACGECEWCITGWETLCPKAQYCGYSVNGGFAEYVIANAKFAAHIPSAFLSSIAVAPLLCAGITTYKGLKETEARPGEWVAIVGVGGLGHLAIQYATAMGLQVVAVDVSEEKLALARQVGSKMTINSCKDDPVQIIDEELGGAQGVLVTAASLAAMRQGVGMTRRHGTCVFLGIPPGNFTLPVFEIVLKRITVRGSLVGTRFDMEEALAMAAAYGVAAHTEPGRLEDINEILDCLRQGKVQGRIVLDFKKEVL